MSGIDPFTTHENRESKARKIEAVVADSIRADRVQGKRILDIGCGSGHIARFFSGSNDVVAADVVDQRSVENRDRPPFANLAGSVLPFEAGFFDIVLLNHVLYYLEDPVRHLREVHRVLKEGGICYLASANRYFPVEGFTGFPFLHYLPGRWFRLIYQRRYGTAVDLFPLGYHAIVECIRKAGFCCRDYTAEIIRHPEKYHGEHALPSGLPVVPCLSPTVVFVLRKQSGDVLGDGWSASGTRADRR